MHAATASGSRGDPRFRQGALDHLRDNIGHLVDRALAVSSGKEKNVLMSHLKVLWEPASRRLVDMVTNNAKRHEEVSAERQRLNDLKLELVTLRDRAQLLEGMRRKAGKASRDSLRASILATEEGIKAFAPLQQPKRIDEAGSYSDGRDGGLFLADLALTRLEQLCHQLRKRMVRLDESREPLEAVKGKYGSLKGLVDEWSQLAEENRMLREAEAGWMDDVVGCRRVLPDFTVGSPARRLVLVWQSWLRALHGAGVMHGIPAREGEDFDVRVSDPEFEPWQGEVQTDSESEAENLRETEKVLAIRERHVEHEAAPGVQSIALTNAANRLLGDLAVIQDRLDTENASVKKLVVSGLRELKSYQVAVFQRAAIYGPYEALMRDHLDLRFRQVRNDQVAWSLFRMCCSVAEELSGGAAGGPPRAFGVMAKDIAADYGEFREKQREHEAEMRQRARAARRNRPGKVRSDWMKTALLTQIGEPLPVMEGEASTTVSRPPTECASREGGSWDDLSEAGLLAAARARGVIHDELRALSRDEQLYVLSLVSNLCKCAEVGGLTTSRFRRLFTDMSCEVRNEFLCGLRPILGEFERGMRDELGRLRDVCTPFLLVTKVDFGMHTVAIEHADTEVETDPQLSLPPVPKSPSKR